MLDNEDKIKKESKIEISSNEIIQSEDTLKKESVISSTKELIAKLIKTSLNFSLTKLEIITKNQNDKLKSIIKNSKDFQKKISKLIIEVDENKKKKEKEREKAKAKARENFKNSKKFISTQTNFRKKETKLEFKTKKLNRNNNNNNNDNKSSSTFYTLNNSIIINEKPKNYHKIQNISNKAKQNDRNRFKTLPSTPTRKKEKSLKVERNNKEKEKNIRNSNILNYKVKKIITEDFPTQRKRNFSKSFSKNPLDNNSEKIDKKKILLKTKTKDFNFKKDIKGKLFKNLKKEFNKLGSTLNVIEEKVDKNSKIEINKKDDNRNNNDNTKKQKNISLDTKIKQHEETIKQQKEEISKLYEELRSYKKDTRKGIYIIRQDKTVNISKNKITINDERVILIKCEPLKYYDSYYYFINYDIEKLISKEIYVDDKKLEDNEYEIEDKNNLKIKYVNTFNDETRKIKVILEIPNEFLHYSTYEINLNKKDVLTKYIITADDDIQIDNVTNEYFKMEKGGNLVCFEGKTTNEIIVKSGHVIFSKKMTYQIYNYIPEYKAQEYDIINLKETNNKIQLNILAKYKKVVITNFGQEVEDLYKIKISNYPTQTYISNLNYPLLLDTKYEVELVELNGEKVEYSAEKSLITITNFGAYSNQFAELYFKYKYINEDNHNKFRQETIITTDIKNSYCKLIIQIPDDYVVLSTNDIFPKNPSNNNEYIFNGISKEDKIKEFVKLSTIKNGEWDIQKEITLEAKENIEKCKFEINRIFKGGNLEEQSYEIINENAELVEDLKENKFIFNYKNLNTNKVKIEWKIKAKNSTSNYIFDGNEKLLIKIPNEDKKFFKDLSDKILKEDKSNFPNYKKLGKWVYNYMTYNLSYVGRKMTAKEIYDKKIGVCEHFSLLYNTLLTSQGINVVKVSGYALENLEKDKNKEDKKTSPNILKDNLHAWSLALIDGVWVPLDATWNLFEKNIPLTHIFGNYGDCSNLTTYDSENNVKNETTKEIIKYIEK